MSGNHLWLDNYDGVSIMEEDEVVQRVKEGIIHHVIPYLLLIGILMLLFCLFSPVEDFLYL